MAFAVGLSFEEKIAAREVSLLNPVGQSRSGFLLHNHGTF